MLSAKFLLLLSAYLQISLAADTIRQGQFLNLAQSIVSFRGKFELGFFTPPKSTKNFYLGIWYKKISIESKTVVWIANREKPLCCTTASSCFLTVTSNGNLVIRSGCGVSMPVTLAVSSGRNTSATLLESGNLVLRDTKLQILWQSFDHPTDTFLPGMKLGINLKTGITGSLTSWRNLEDPAPGDFSLVPDRRSPQIFIINKEAEKHWISGVWVGDSFLYVPEVRKQHIFNFSYFSNENESYFTYSPFNKSTTSRFILDSYGKMKHLAWFTSTQKWTPFCELPRDQCHVYSYCGAFSSCDPSESPSCQCLHGFKPHSPANWNQQDWSEGCSRETSLQCGDQDGFLLMPKVSLPLNFKSLAVGSAAECKIACLNNCSCSAYSYSTSGCSVWHGDLLNIRPSEYGVDLFFRLAASDVKRYGDFGNKTLSSHTTNRAQRHLILALPSALLVVVLVLISSWYCSRRRKLMQRGAEDVSQDLLSFDFTTRTKATKGKLSGRNKVVCEETWSVELPFFSLESVFAATNNFNEANKLGQGGFGPVYKGKLLNGQQVAIKRLSKGSGQGLEEFKNETTVMAKVQHINLVRLLGCCTEDQEKILIYEYLPNKSLDLFLFDPTKQAELNLERRIRIIEGIAQGLLYLHKYSRLQIIHRDLKPSNILLDDEMNPKISDFGMARISRANVTKANTTWIVGTYGYMPPEYAIRGLFSVKSDVFSFGVLLLEILSGKKNTTFHHPDSLNLIGQAWNLWRSGNGLKLIDPTLGNSPSTLKTLRYIHVALLCVQEQANDRPTTSDIVAMLSTEVGVLPSPKVPAFSFTSGVDDSNNTSVICSINNLTISTIICR